MVTESKQIIPGKGSCRICPHCDLTMKATCIVNDCEDGYRYWSDGQADGGMFPVVVIWAKCPGCGLPFAIVTAKRADISKGSLGRKLPTMVTLDNDAYRFLIDKAIGSGNYLEEKQLRIDCWHHLHDVIRPGHRRKSPSVAVRNADLAGNLSRLVELLDDAKPRDRLLKAEAFRELGAFDRCLELLVDAPDALRWLASHIAIHAASGNEQLFGLLKAQDGWLPLQAIEADPISAVGEQGRP